MSPWKTSLSIPEGIGACKLAPTTVVITLAQEILAS